MSTPDLERDGRRLEEGRHRGRSAISRVVATTPWALFAVLGAIAFLTASAGLRLPQASGHAYQRLVTPAGFTDTLLYKEITARVQTGEDYYRAATSSQRAHHYPLRPAVAVREPTEAWLLAVLGSDLGRRAALFLLVIFTTETVRRALSTIGMGLPGRLYGVLAVGQSLVYAALPDGPYVHEVWAGLLLTSSVAVWRPGRYGMSVALAFTACLFREIAAPALLAMIFCAAADRRWREVWAWGAAAAAFGLLAAAHLWLVSHQILATDLASPGWTAVGGWPFILANARENLLLALLPAPAASVATSLALLGLASARGPWARRLAAVTFAFVALFWFVGRPDNAYWGNLYGPLLALGLIWAPRALRDLSRPGVLFKSWESATRGLPSIRRRILVRRP